MGANAATKLYRVVQNYERIVAIEWMTACQALDFRNEKSSSQLEELKSKYRSKVAFVVEDVTFYPLIEKSIQFIREN
jgi:histidine ammonia-lyase